MTKRLFIDIETSKLTAATFTLFPNYIPVTNILDDWHIICAAWKWQGSDEIYSAHTYNSNDKKIVKELSKAINEADELVYHNGRKFDYKKINARVVINGLPPMCKPRETDTLIQCKKHFAFTSNKLEYIARALGFGGKISTGDELWMRCLRKEREAIDEMLEYNKYDVILLEKVFDKLAPYIDLGYNVNIDKQLGDKCPKCGSDDLIKRGFFYTKTCKYQKYSCNKCGGWCSSGNREKRTIVPIR